MTGGMGDEYGFGATHGSAALGGTAHSVVQNQPFDEEVELTDEESVEEELGSARLGAGLPLDGGGDDFGATFKRDELAATFHRDELAATLGGRGTDPERAGSPPERGDSPPAGAGDLDEGTLGPGGYEDLGEPEEDEGPKHGEDHGGEAFGRTQRFEATMEAGGTGGRQSGDGGARPKSEPDEGTEARWDSAEEHNDLRGLEVPEEIRDMFQYIDRYRPPSPDLETMLKPFIPDYIPAVGDIDEFIKVPRPDGRPDLLGLKTLDEPAPMQSDPTVLSMQIRSISKKSNLQPIQVTSLQAEEQTVQRITNWIDSIAELHKSKPPPVVTYSKQMPEIETLMEEWPGALQTALRKFQLPDAELNVSLQEYIGIICAILGVPVYSNAVESLHVIFTLLLEFQNNPFLNGPPAPAGGHAQTMTF